MGFCQPWKVALALSCWQSSSAPSCAGKTATVIVQLLALSTACCTFTFFPLGAGKASTPESAKLFQLPSARRGRPAPANQRVAETITAHRASIQVEPHRRSRRIGYPLKLLIPRLCLDLSDSRYHAHTTVLP